MGTAAKRLVIVGGPNGAGKTTLARDYAAEHGLRYLGADEIAASLDPARPASMRIVAARAFSQQLRAALAAGQSLVVESTLSGGTLALHLDDASRRGYMLTLVMVFLDSSDLCLRRIAQRVARGGHDVPEIDVRRRFTRSLRQFLARYRWMVNEWLVLFNGEAGYVTVATGQGQAPPVIFDEALWTLFERLSAQGDSDGDSD